MKKGIFIGGVLVMAAMFSAQAQTASGSGNKKQSNKGATIQQGSSSGTGHGKAATPTMTGTRSTANLPAKDGSSVNDAAATNDGASGQSGSPVALPAGGNGKKASKSQGRSKQ